MGEELDDGEGFPCGPEEGVEAGGVEVDGGVPLRCRGGGVPLADAERAEGVGPWRSGGEEEDEDGEGEEARRASHVDRGRLDLRGGGPGFGDPFRTHTT